MRIAVAGCGIAGLASAILLVRSGHEVELFDRFVEPQPIGSGLIVQPTGLAVLDQLGVADQIIAAGSRIERLRGEADGRVVLSVDYSALGASHDWCGIGIHRAALFDLLFEQVLASRVRVRGGCEVEAVRQDRDLCWLGFADSAEAGPFDVIIDALGTRSALAPECGRDLAYGALWTNVALPDQAFDPAALSQRYRRANIMAGVLPIGRNPIDGLPQAALFWSLRADQHEAWRAAGLGQWKEDVCALWPATGPLLDQISSLEQLTFARYSHRTLRHPVEGNLIHIGDSWHSASPQLGQGANMALLDAFALAVGLGQTSNPRDGLRHAVVLRRRHVRLYQWITLFFTPVYQSDSRVIPAVRDRVMAPLSKIWPLPWVQAALVSGLVGDPLSPLGLGFAPLESTAKAKAMPQMISGPTS